MSTYEPNIKVLGADFHRNGSGGAGFHIVLFKDVETPEAKGKTFLAIQFEDNICHRCGGSGEYQGAKIDGTTHKCEYCGGSGAVYPGNTEATAVFDVNEAAAGNIYMFPEYNSMGDEIYEGGNAMRGADYYGKQIAEGKRKYMEQSEENAERHWDKVDEEKRQKAARLVAEENGG